eukprot:CAMPEP_0116991654 /NCGR_PEP_ID=MMETSP0467-20121206/66279_1 /TAXON_ID=283647 /ORGANISM="Mesodinium pulex, Strain SPMC105" /LENGTH=59 /DNA_ID=CAMNT_0004688803 /DNA_START=1072 /DNA_END=1251 /DNA_ORIENTATION=+
MRQFVIKTNMMFNPKNEDDDAEGENRQSDLQSELQQLNIEINKSTMSNNNISINQSRVD